MAAKILMCVIQMKGHMGRIGIRKHTHLESQRKWEHYSAAILDEVMLSFYY
jgi:hypothetical protein